MNVESELKDIINRLYDIQDVSGPDLSKKIYEIILQCREAIGYRKAELDRVQSSRKPIKSGFAQRNAGMIMDKLDQCDKIVKTCISISPDSRLTEELSELEDKIDDVATYAEMLSNGDEKIQSSRKPIKSGNEQVNKNLTEEDINEAADYFDITYDEAKAVLSIPNYDVEWDDIPFVVNTVNEFMNGDFSNIESVSYVDEDNWIPILKKPEVEDMFQFRFEGVTKYTMTDGSERYVGFGGEDDIDVTDYYLKASGKNKINSSKKPIKSSLEDRLVPYLEEFEEGYADALSSTDEMGSNVRLDTFYEIFKNDHNLNDDDISKLEGTVQDIWHETEEEITEHDMGEMYGVPHGATPEEALKVFESKKPIKSGSMSGYFSGICDKCKQFTNVHYVGYKGRKLCMRCSRGR